MPLPLSPGGARPFGAMAAVILAGASLVGAAAVGWIFLGTARDAWTAISVAGPAGPADGILLVAALGGVLLSLWLGLGVGLSALSALPGAVGHACRCLAGRTAPAAVRKVVAFVLGTTLSAALVPGSAAAGAGLEAPHPGVVAAAGYAIGAVRAVADAAPDASFRFISGSVHVDLDDVDDGEAAPLPSWSPERPLLPQRTMPPERTISEERTIASERVVPRKPAPAEVHGSSVRGIVVHRGETLWSIAARHLGPMATAAAIDAECHRWFATNREVIGDDANLILPGQLLSPPASPPSPKRNS